MRAGLPLLLLLALFEFGLLWLLLLGVSFSLFSLEVFKMLFGKYSDRELSCRRSKEHSFDVLDILKVISLSTSVASAGHGAYGDPICCFLVLDFDWVRLFLTLARCL